jgi:predicted PurR-regulated permease PerM
LTNQQPFMNRSALFAVAFFGVFLYLLYQMLRLLAPFGSALLLAAVLAIALHPIHTWLSKLLKGREKISALLMTLFVILLIIGPAITLFGVLTTQAVDVYQGIATGMQSGKFPQAWSGIIDRILHRISEYPGFSTVDVKGLLLKSLGGVSSGLAAQFGALLKNTVILAVDLAVMLIALFFFFLSGDYYYNSIIDMLPFSSENKKAVANKVHDTFIAVINGVFLIALVQGALTGVGFALFGLPVPVFWGSLAAICALLPVGGAALVWLPGVLFLYVKGSILRCILLLFWGLIFVTLPDNIVKPILIGRKAKIPTFFLFISILGGLNAYGIFGVLLGPIVVTMLSAFIHIYRAEYSDN